MGSSRGELGEEDSRFRMVRNWYALLGFDPRASQPPGFLLYLKRGSKEDLVESVHPFLNTSTSLVPCSLILERVSLWSCISNVKTPFHLQDFPRRKD